MGQPLLQANFHQIGLLKAYMVVYLMKAYYIPLTLVINNNQIKVHLEHNDGERTWETKKTKHVQVLHWEDTRQITMTVSSNVTWDLPPPQIVFIGITSRTFPPNNQRKRKCIKDGWDFIFSENHWSSLETTKQFITNIFLIIFNHIFKF
jgi:hypothetical protein